MIVIMKEWRDRAFLRAELREAGINALAVDTLAEALPWVLDADTPIELLIYDTHAQEHPSKDIASLRLLLKSFPVLIITDAPLKPGDDALRGFAHVIPRPLTIGDIVEKARSIISA